MRIRRRALVSCSSTKISYFGTGAGFTSVTMLMEGILGGINRATDYSYPIGRGRRSGIYKLFTLFNYSRAHIKRPSTDVLGSSDCAPRRACLRGSCVLGQAPLT